jgi:DNA-directed RNA polymerase subunit RPC12/RpoP
MDQANAVRMMCPNLKCRAVLAVPVEARGRLIRCRNCGSKIMVPQKAAPKAQPAKPDAA